MRKMKKFFLYLHYDPCIAFVHLRWHGSVISSLILFGKFSPHFRLHGLHVTLMLSTRSCLNELFFGINDIEYIVCVFQWDFHSWQANLLISWHAMGPKVVIKLSSKKLKASPLIMLAFRLNSIYLSLNRSHLHNQFSI